MKVDKVVVNSYGGMRSRVFELDPGFNVFYGPNEAGKSTLRSFITMTLFPKSGLKYPVQKGSDSGSLEVTLYDGGRMIFERDGKRCSGLGSELCGIDDKEYCTIYSVSPESLRDVKGFEKGEIRNRFLTIPGGADLPRAYESLDAERLKLLPETKRSAKCEIAQLIVEEHECSMKVRELQNRESGDSNYAGLVKRREELESEIRGLSEKLSAADALRTASHRAEGRSADLSKIAELEAKEKELSYSEGVDPAKLALLDSDVKRLREESDMAARVLEVSLNELRGVDIETFRRNRKRIEATDRYADEYDYLKSRAEYERRPAAPVRPESKRMSKKTAAVAVAGAVGAGVAVAAVLANPLGLAISAVGAVAVIIVYMRSGGKTDVPEPVAPGSSQDDARITYIENLLNDIANDTCIPRRGFHADIDTLTETLRTVDALDSAQRRSDEASGKLGEAEEKLRLFLDGYGGRGGFSKAVEDAKTLSDIRSRLGALRESTASAEVVEVTAEDADAAYNEALEEYKAADRELARITQSIRDITDDMTVEDAISERSDAESAVYAASYRWARLMLEKIILDNASTNAYGGHKPSVIGKADLFLSEMTGGRYRMDTDPRITEIAVIDSVSGISKTDREWSSGLEDQVKLSIKMAVSLSLSKEKPPVILDDVLLTSDSGRKDGACRALALLSEEIQVLYFTCDRESRDLLEKAGAKVIEV